MAQEKGYKCPSCGGAMAFDPASGKLKCPFCGSDFIPEEYDRQKAANSGAPGTEWSLNADDMQVFTCNNCGGEVIGDENTGALTCPYCDEPLVLNERFTGSLKPEFVLPFKIDKSRAKSAYGEYIAGKKLLPNIFKNDKHISDIKGVYVPFWLYDATVNASAEFDGTKETDQGDSTKIDHFKVTRSGTMSFKHIPVDASTRMEDDLMDSIEPYDVSAAVPYSSAYMAGYLADRYDVSPEQCQPRADKRMEQTARDLIRGQVKNYDSVSEKSHTFNKLTSSYKYALYPVWILNTIWNGEKFVFAMNGQTGKLVGNVPYSKGKFFGVLFGVLAALWAIMLGVLAVTSHFSTGAIVGTGVASVIIALIVAFSMKGKTKSVHKGTQAMNFVVNGSLRITNSHDNFIRKTEEKTAKSSS